MHRKNALKGAIYLKNSVLGQCIGLMLQELFIKWVKYMLKSMTGYGRCETVDGGKKILAEVRSVNHRYSDYSVKVPRYYGFLEDKVRKKVAESASRGKIDVYIAVESYGDSDAEISLKEEFAKEYIEALYQLRDKFGLKDDISVCRVARNQEIFNVERKSEDEDEIWDLVEPVLDEAIKSFVAMREREGARIQQDLESRIGYMKMIAAKINERSPQTVEEYKERLYAKIKEILDDGEVDENRVLTEVAVFADKIAVDEELVRLGSHFEEFYNIMNSPEPAGRKLDFLIQEINREVNTTGSKANDIEIAKLVVTLKGEIEKLREQVQNIE